MKTTIDDYIKRHALTKRNVKPEGQWIPATLLPEDREDKFEIYANDDATHIVAINTTKKRFKIVYGDLLFLESGWKDGQISYETDARPFWEDEF